MLRLAGGEAYTRSIVIVGVEEKTGQGKLATMTVALENGQGRLLINVPPYENEDTQKSFEDAVKAAEHETGLSLEQTDIVISIENLSKETTIAGPSASAAVAVALVAAIRASENVKNGPSEVRQDAVVSARVDSLGRLGPVGEVNVKYRRVREEGHFSLFIVAADQPEHLPNYPGIRVEKVLNLHELADLMLMDTGGITSSEYETQPSAAVI